MTDKPFIDDSFLLRTKTAQDLYSDFARDMPVIDYHCHLPPADIAEDRRFNNLHEVWLEGDHYKWRAMRTNGEPEKYCTGDADPFEKFMAWARTVPKTLRNPLYHWTHLELKRYFNIDKLLSEETGPEIWERANKALASDDLSVQGILRRFKVVAFCTTDDPADSLEHHDAIARSGCGCKVFPAFRPDKAMAAQDPADFKAWLARFERAAGGEIANFKRFLEALESRHEFFHMKGCRLSDHGLAQVFAEPCTEGDADAVFEKARNGLAVSEEEARVFASFMMLFFGRLDAERGWTMQLHLGVMRNNNSRMFERLGPDTGFDSIGDYRHARPLAEFLDRLDRSGDLPKTIIYNINPADNYLMGTMLGNFQDGSVPGKVQLGSGWWFLDQKDGIEWQLNALSNLGLLSRFVGMLTDSRSFMSFPRHEYFRRVLCNLLGDDIENGLLPDDPELVGGMVRDICFNNARDYFGLGL